MEELKDLKIYSASIWAKLAFEVHKNKIFRADSFYTSDIRGSKKGNISYLL